LKGKACVVLARKRVEAGEEALVGLTQPIEMVDRPQRPFSVVLSTGERAIAAAEQV
jgi:hypothetical protein